ncbi:MAG: DUF1566 domain-containing protein [Bryobacteraceae bacterium]|nr:DUF1566 domain-containing protein [Bryobacteraceae bacterium]
MADVSGHGGRSHHDQSAEEVTVFISYRRDDTGPHAGRLHDRLSEWFGSENVFRDIDDIEPGQDFTQVLAETVGRSNALVVLIGARWLSPRLASPDDFVRREIAMAMGRGIPVFPVLVDGGRMPAAGELPADLQPLALRQALEITDARYHEDTGRLITALEGRTPNRKATRRMLLAAASLLIATTGAWMYQSSQTAPAQTLRLRSGGATVSREQLNAAVMRHNFYAKSVNESGGAQSQLERQVKGEAVVVIDRATGLMWQQGGSRRGLDHAGAAAVVNAANTSKLAGFDDWRLPTAEEALSLMTRKQQDGFYLDPLFDRMAAPFVWTSDRHSEGKGWVVYYKDGYPSPESTAFNAPVRLVRKYQ